MFKKKKPVDKMSREEIVSTLKGALIAGLETSHQIKDFLRKHPPRTLSMGHLDALLDRAHMIGMDYNNDPIISLLEHHTSARERQAQGRINNILFVLTFASSIATCAQVYVSAGSVSESVSVTVDVDGSRPTNAFDWLGWRPNKITVPFKAE